jgi:hypothetical protein
LPVLKKRNTRQKHKTNTAETGKMSEYRIQQKTQLTKNKTEREIELTSQTTAWTMAERVAF